MAETGLSHDQSLHQEVVDAFFQLTIGLTHAFESVDQTLQAPFMRPIVLHVPIRILSPILLKVVILLIDGIIG